MFQDWLNQTNQNQSFLEKAQQELVYQRYTDNHSFWKIILSWLESAYIAGKKENLSIIESLKIEIRTQRKEISILREERRTLLDRDKVPEIGWKE